MTMLQTAAIPAGGSSSVARLGVIAAISFLTLVDLFATQAILPSLARAYAVPPAVIGPAVNLCTLGMAIAGFAIALFGRRIDRRIGVAASLALLAIPTLLLSLMPDLMVFAGLRLVQGLFMSAAFTLTMAYLAENAGPEGAASALAAYVTGNVASNLVGRLVSAAVSDHFGLAANFSFFAGLNLAGAVLAYFALRQRRPMTASAGMMQPNALRAVLSQLEFDASFAIGFLILFAFIGTFTYVNFVLTSGPIGLSPMQLGFVYFVFVPSIILTPLAGRAAAHFGTRATIVSAFAAAILGLPLLVTGNLPTVLLGLVLVAAGTFFAQAAATGFVSRASGSHRATASGLYLASYYAGGLAGSFVLGALFDRLGWTVCVLVIGLALLGGAALATRLKPATNS